MQAAPGGAIRGERTTLTPQVSFSSAGEDGYIMFYRIKDIEGISVDYARTLEKAGITTTEHLLSKAHDPKARGQLAVQTGIGEKHLARWLAMADLMRIRGVGRQYGELLMAIGVDSGPKLLTMTPRELVRQMEEHRKAKRLVGGTPKLVEVERWQDELRTPAFVHAK
jgi:predicted flap endonuclease-1-like 5' DNA nuclease